MDAPDDDVYVPMEDLRRRHPGWRVELDNKASSSWAKVDRANHVIEFDLDHLVNDPDLTVAYIVALLDVDMEDHHAPTHEELKTAMELAEKRLGRPPRGPQVDFS